MINNINDRAKVRLTELGKAQYRIVYHKEPKDEMTFMIWELMCIFGPTLFMGQRDIPFINNEFELIRS